MPGQKGRLMKYVQEEAVEVYRDPDRYMAEADVVCLGGDEMLAVFAGCVERVHRDEDDVMMIRSHDGGASWDQDSLETIWHTSMNMGACNPGVSRLSDGTLIMHTLMNSCCDMKGIQEDFGPQSESLFAMREAEGTFCMMSTDKGAAWGELYKINCVPMHWCQPADGITELPNGVLLMPVAGMRSNAWNHPQQNDLFRSFTLRSDDRGKSWEYYSTIAYDAAQIMGFHEPGMCRTADGKLVCLMRTHHGVRTRHGHLWLAWSGNDGESWSRPEATNIWGYPSDLTPLADGRVLATYGHRRDPWSVRGCISDNGLKWDVSNEFTIHKGGRGPASAGGTRMHTGYPASIQLDDGSILSIWHEWTQDELPVQYILSKRYELPA